MRKLIAIFLKDTRLRFSSASEWLFFLILPLLFTFFLGGGLRGAAEAAAESRVEVLVVNEASGPLADALAEALAASTAVAPLGVDAAEAAARWDDREAAALLTIPAGFAAALTAGEPVDLPLRLRPNSTDSLVVAQAVQQAADEVSAPLVVAAAIMAEAAARRPFADAAAADAFREESRRAAAAQLAAAPEPLTVTRPAASDEPGFDPAGHASVGQLLTWVLIPLLGASGILVDERARGTLRRLLVTPTRRHTFLLGTVASQLGLGLVQMLLLVTFGVLVMGVNWGQSPAGLALMLVTFGLAAVGLGVMLGAFLKTPNQASAASVMLGMVMALLGGAWYPIELFPARVQEAVQVLPTTWAMRGLSAVALRGQGAADVLTEAAVLLAFAAAFLLIGVWRYRYE